MQIAATNIAVTTFIISFCKQLHWQKVHRYISVWLHVSCLMYVEVHETKATQISASNNVDQPACTCNMLFAGVLASRGNLTEFTVPPRFQGGPLDE